MGLGQFKTALFIATGILLLSSGSNAQSVYNEQQMQISLRMIGHQVLLNSGDSTSRVLPIAWENGCYRIQFESEFTFNPEELVSTIDRVVKETVMASSYIVEVEKSESGEVVYSFKKDYLEKSDIIPCKTRVQPKSHYSILFTIIKSREANMEPLAATSNSSHGSTKTASQVYFALIGIVLLSAVILIFFIWKIRNKPSSNSNFIPLGKYYFDECNAALIIEQQKIELTSKESDLLLLLYNAVNTTVERDAILNKVWGDEGVYVGRTLDVFISKLRKKLEFDSNVKIVNTRGVGYKLVMAT